MMCVLIEQVADVTAPFDTWTSTMDCVPIPTTYITIKVINKEAVFPDLARSWHPEGNRYMDFVILIRD